MDAGLGYVTKCLPCTTSLSTSGTVASYAQGTTFYASSCVCNNSFYGVQEAPNALVCTACTSSTSQPWHCSDTTKALSVTSCASSGAYRTTSFFAINAPENACDYTAPPFGTLTQTGQSGAFSCPSTSTFTKTDTGVVFLKGATGSSLYAPASPASWTPLYKQLGSTTCTSDAYLDDTAVSNLAISQTPIGTNGNAADVYVPYVFWTPAFIPDSNYPRKVYANCFSGDGASSHHCPPVLCVHNNVGTLAYTVPPWKWSIADTDALSAIEALSVSEWFTNTTTSSMYLYVAVVVRIGNTLRLQVATVYLQQAANTQLFTMNVPVADAKSFNTVIATTMDMSAVQVVDMIYAPSYASYDAPGRPTPVWIVAFNRNTTASTYKCGIVIYGVQSPVQYATIDLCAAHVYVDPAFGSTQQPARTAIRSISVISLLATMKFATVLVVFRDFPNVVYQTTIIQDSNPMTTPSASDLLVYATTAAPAQTLSSIRATYPFTDNPSILGLVSGTQCDITQGGSSDANCLFAADVTQQTFVPIQNAPFGSNPTRVATAPSVLYAPSAYLTNSAIVASYGSRIYALGVSRCAEQGMYWNGERCTLQQCKRRPQCTTVQTWRDSRCTCIDGYYLNSNAGTCQACTAGKFCSGEQEYKCIDASTSNIHTQTSRATSRIQCLCDTTGYYAASSSAASCSQCPVASYCPNSWDSFSCPGMQDVSRMSVRGAVTPVRCVCRPGYYSATCIQCPDGSVCKGGIVTANNQVCPRCSLQLLFKLDIANVCVCVCVQAQVYKISTTTTGYSRADLIQRVRQALTEYYSVAAQRVAGSDQIIATSFITIATTTHNTDLANMDILVVMMQGLPAPTTSVVGWINAITSYSYTNLTLVVDDHAYESYDSVLVNRPIACTALQQPDPTRTACICIPGTGVNADGTCALCAANYYSTIVGTQQQPTCQQCPLGTWTNQLAGQTNCSTIPPGTASNAASSQSINSIAIIAGSVGGLLVVIIVVVIVYCLRKNKRNPGDDEDQRQPLTALFAQQLTTKPNIIPSVVKIERSK